MNCMHLPISMHTISIPVCVHALHACMKFSVCLHCMHAQFRRVRQFGPFFVMLCFFQIWSKLTTISLQEYLKEAALIYQGVPKSLCTLVNQMKGSKFVCHLV